jgi:hypothetical protein
MCIKDSLDPPMGNFGVCPPEILFNILDDVLWSSPDLTHENLCVINKLRKTNKILEQLVEYWMMGRKVHDYINGCVSNQWCLNPSSTTSESVIWQLFVFKEPFGAGNDLITGIIRDDCVDCYNWLCVLMPEDERFPDNLMACLNEQGWTFFSLAVHAKADKMLHGHPLPGSCQHNLDEVD